MTALVIRGDAAHLPLPDASVDLIVTSPPYYGLRSYTDGGEHYAGQIGSEPTPAAYIEGLVECTMEWVRVLKPTGSLFVNLGDKYSQRVATRPSSHQDGLFPNRPELRKDWKRDREAGLARMPYENIIDLDSGAYVREKSLMGLPWRYALACTDQLQLILRAEIIWAKPNGLPESVTDRVRRSHEQWFHFTVQPRYYAAIDEIREPHTGNMHARRKDGTMSPKEVATVAAGHRRGFFPETTENPLGKLPGSVWTIPSQPLTVPPHLGVDHFAAFPMEWPRRIILGWSPPGICTACGEGRRPVAASEYQQAQATNSAYKTQGRAIPGRDPVVEFVRMRQTTTITGYRCACPAPVAPTRPAVVLDPFGGTGTTALLASALGRTGISIDRSADYSRLARWRTTDPAQRAQALQVGKPPVEVDGQLDMFDEGATA